MQHDNHESLTQEERQNFRFKGFIPKSLNIWVAPLRDLVQTTNHRKFIEIDHDTNKITPGHIAIMALGKLVVISIGVDPNGGIGKNSTEFHKVKKLLSDLRFVQIRDFDRRFKVTFPKTKPGYFIFPGEVAMTEIITRYLMGPENIDAIPFLDFLPGRFDIMY